MTPKHSRIHQPAVGLLPQYYLIGEGVSLPELLSAPLSSVGAQPATLMAAAPVRQRSGPAGPRAQLPPCYYEGYLETRGPKEKVGSPVHIKCHVVAMRAIDGVGSVYWLIPPHSH